MATTSSPFRALTNYRVLPKMIGWPPLIVAFVARAPYAMLPLGILTAFTASTNDVAIGGLATAVFSLSVAFASPLVGRAADLWGQRSVLFTLIPLNSSSIGALYLTAQQSSPGWYLWVLCAAAGCTTVPIGSFTRARWVKLTASPYQLSAAFSYESMADELVFVLGPALVGIAASMLSPSAPLALAAFLMLTAGLSFAVTAPRQAVLTQETEESGLIGTQISKKLEQVRPSIGNVLWRVFPSILILILVGTYFGATQAATTVRAEALGSPEQAGFVYATMGIGSALTSLLVVVIPAKISLSTRIAVCSFGMAATLALVNLQPTLGLTALFLGLAGLWVGPTLVTAFTLTERLAPTGGISVALTAMVSSVTIGVSFGSAAGGVIGAKFGSMGAFSLAVAAGLAILVVAIALQFLFSREQFSTV